ncbi:MAG: hypothetical protein ACK421_10920, partial [Pseudanabaenaceae cyanobacterium]
MTSDLVEVVRWAWEEAQRQKCKILVNYTQKYVPPDVISFTAAQRGARRFIWQRGDHYLAGGGHLWSLAGGNLRDWGGAIAAFDSRWRGVCPPYWLGGMSFSPGGESCL